MCDDSSREIGPSWLRFRVGVRAARLCELKEVEPPSLPYVSMGHDCAKRPYAYCYMIVMGWMKRARRGGARGVPSPGVVQAVGSGALPLGLGAKKTAIGGAGSERV